MEVTTTEFVGSFPSLSAFPRRRLPEIAFIGRSNVGKSSLINRLLGVKRLALTSSTPGKTQRINLFCVNGSLFFVDLPGYGFARVPKREQAGWRRMVEEYLLGGGELRLLVLLFDARHALQANDRQMVEWLGHHRLPYLPVFTKADKLKRNDLAKLRRTVQDPDYELHGAKLCSAKTGMGMKDIWSVIDASRR